MGNDQVNAGEKYSLPSLNFDFRFLIKLKDEIVGKKFILFPSDIFSTCTHPLANTQRVVAYIRRVSENGRS